MSDPSAGEPPIAPIGTRRRLERVAFVAVVVVAVIGVAVMWNRRETDTRPPVTTQPVTTVDGVTTRLILARTSVVAGGSIAGEVEVVNATGRPLHGSRCGSPFAVELHGKRSGQAMLFAACDEVLTIPTGASTWPVTVAATWSACVHPPDEASPSMPRCTDQGTPPALEPGRYQAIVVGQVPLVSSAPPVDVDVR